jgi:hypothetical protein
MRARGRYKYGSNNCGLLKSIGKESPIGCLTIVSQCLTQYIELKCGKIKGWVENNVHIIKDIILEQ